MDPHTSDNIPEPISVKFVELCEHWELHFFCILKRCFVTIDIHLGIIAHLQVISEKCMMENKINCVLLMKCYILHHPFHLK